MEDKWISVEERLPTKTGKYRIKGFLGAFQKTTFDEVAVFKTNATGGRFMFGFDWCKITHWMEED